MVSTAVPSSPVAPAEISLAVCSSKLITLRFRAEEASHLRGQLGVERLVDGGENAAAQQARDQILGANFQLLRQILYADAFRDRDAARDRLRLVRHHHARRRRVALHRAFLHTARNIALAGTPRRSSGTGAGTRWPGRRRSWTHSNGSRTRRRLARGMHGPALARTQGRTRWRWVHRDGRAEKSAARELAFRARAGAWALPPLAELAARAGAEPNKPDADRSAA